MHFSGEKKMSSAYETYLYHQTESTFAFRGKKSPLTRRIQLKNIKRCQW